MKFWFVITIYLVLYYKTARAHIECAPTGSQNGKITRRGGFYIRPLNCALSPVSTGEHGSPLHSLKFQNLKIPLFHL